MKKKIALLVVVMMIGTLIGCGNKDKEGTEVSSGTKDGKSIVVYYSAEGHTKTAANYIAKEVGADTFEIVPTNIYTEDDLNWRNEDSRVSIEHDNEDKRDIELISTKVENWESYDTVFVGYPIWWGIAACPIDNFIKANDFSGKTVIPFCTSTSSGIGESGELLEKMAGTGKWQEGERFGSNVLEGDIEDWVKGLAY